MPSKFYNSKLNTVLLAILIILMLAALRFMYKNQRTYLPKESNNQSVETVDKTMSPIENKGSILGNKDDLTAFSIAPNTKVHGIVSYRGSVKGGYFFEGNILINILDKNKKVLKSSNATATTEWTISGPVEFEGNIDFTNLKNGDAYFEIKNDNASGDPQYDKSILIPIIIEPTPKFDSSSDSAVIALTKDNDGKIITASIGNTITVTLVNPGDGGYKFDDPKYDSTILSLTSHENEAPTNLMPGNFGKDIWHFTVIKNGTSNITITARRPWESVNPITLFNTTIKIK